MKRSDLLIYYKIVHNQFEGFQCFDSVQNVQDKELQTKSKGNKLISRSNFLTTKASEYDNY